MIYMLGWILLVALSLWVSVAAFIWAYQSGQFSDQTRARYLPLKDGLPLNGTEDTLSRRIEKYALMAVAAIGLSVMLAILLVSLYRLGG
jgi:cbb3-type cytochrome oxidase maturation protein